MLTKKRNLTSLKTILFLSLFFFIYTTPSLAQTFTGQCSVCNIIEAIDSLSQRVEKIANFTAKKTAELLYEPNLFTPSAIAGNKAVSGLPEQISNNVASAAANTYTETSPTGKSQTYPNPTSIDNMLNMQSTDAAKISQYFGNLCGADYDENCKVSPNIFQPGQAAAQQQQVQQYKSANFNAASLLDNQSYDPNSLGDQAAKNYIAYLSDSVNPFTVLSEATKKQLESQGQLNGPDLQQYRTQIRSFVAQLSMGLNNLYYIYAQHLKVPSLGKNAGFAGQQNANMSPMELDEKMANRRIADPNWYNQMSTASPVTVSRETLFLLAEMRNEMYQQRILQERLLATMSALQIQFATTRKIGLESTRTEAESVTQPEDTESAAPTDLNQ